MEVTVGPVTHRGKTISRVARPGGPVAERLTAEERRTLATATELVRRLMPE